jgi:predicted metal-binding membrane protein
MVERKPPWQSRRIWSAALNAIEAACWAVFLWLINSPETQAWAMSWVRNHVDAAALPMVASAVSAVLAWASRRWPSSGKPPL